MVWLLTLFGALTTLGLSSYQGYIWHKRSSRGFGSLVAALVGGFLIGMAAVLGVEAASSFDYFVAVWAVDGLATRHVVLGGVFGSGPAAAGWLARRGQTKRQGPGPLRDDTG